MTWKDAEIMATNGAISTVSLGALEAWFPAPCLEMAGEIQSSNPASALQAQPCE